MRLGTGRAHESANYVITARSTWPIALLCTPTTRGGCGESGNQAYQHISTFLSRIEAFTVRPFAIDSTGTYAHRQISFVSPYFHGS